MSLSPRLSLRSPIQQISFSRETYTFRSQGSPSAFVADFRNYYGPTMNAFAAAEQNGKAADLQKDLEALFESQNTSEVKGATSVPATCVSPSPFEPSDGQGISQPGLNGMV